MAKLVPNQRHGSELNVMRSLSFGDNAEAERAFRLVKSRLLDVNRWHFLTQPPLAVFLLTDKRGNPLNGNVRKGYLFKISSPLPQSINGDGFDWVEVEEIKDITKKELSLIAVRVRPVASPMHPNAGTSHFFKSDATSTFEAQRIGGTVTVGIFGRNELPNTESENFVDTLRNFAVAAGAALFGSQTQWDRLAEGLVRGFDQEEKTF
ncbi:hypothetical protein BH09BAC3_BH09BAC3_19610 [soil metagenome]